MILLSAAGCQTKVEQATAPVQDESIAVETQTPQIGDLALTTEFIGTIEPDEQVSVIPKVGGTVLHTYAEVGQTVKKGDLLFEIDDSDAALAYRMAQAGYEQRMISADTTLGSGYESRVLAAKAQVDAAQQNLNNTRLKLKDYNDGYDDSLIMAEKRRDEAEQKMKAAEEAYKNYTGDDQKEKEELYKAWTQAESDYSMYRSAVNDLEDSEDSEARDLRNAYKNAQTNYEQALNNYNLLLGGSLEDTQRAMEADLKSAELSLEQSASTLDKYKIYAPIDGVIEQKNISEQSLASPSSVAYTLSNKSTIMTTFYVPSGAVEQMAVGDSVT
ncbi:HlyD family secretion protein, partial [Anaerotruncus colihominis]